MKPQFGIRGWTLLSLGIVVALALAILLSGLRFPWTHRPAGVESLFPQVAKLVSREYVDPVDPAQAAPGAFEGFLEPLHPLAGYLDAGETRLFRRITAGEDCWTGITAELTDDSPRVAAVAPASPAGTAGIRTGDELRGHPGQSLILRSALAVRVHLSSERPQTLALRLRRPGERIGRTVTLTTRPFSHQPQVQREEGGVTWLTLPWIGPEAERCLRELAAGPEPRLRLVIDLRACRGGDWPSWRQVAAVFFPGEAITLERKGRSEEWILPKSPSLAWQAVVLAGPACAPAGELLAALFVRHGTPLLGEATTGKVALLEQLPLEDGSSVVLPVGFFALHGERLTAPLSPTPLAPEAASLPLEDAARQELKKNHAPAHP